MYRGYALFLWLIARTVLAQHYSCDLYQNVTANSIYPVDSPGYPMHYTGRLRCRWTVVCPIGYNCRLDCPWIEIPPTRYCNSDRLLVSKSGNPALYPALRYCGHGSFTVKSTGQIMTIGLIASENTMGGRFSCKISAQVDRQTESCTCGERRQNRIVGGEEPGINEYKMMVGIVYLDYKMISSGAVILSDKYALTAAHSVVRRTVNNTVIIVGEHNVTTGKDTTAAKIYRIESFTIHPSYKDTEHDYDIAIINVAEPIEFNDRVGPVCLPFKFVNTDLSGKKVTILGWGSTSFSGPVSDVLLKADVNIMTEEECRAKDNDITPRHICTYTPEKDSCQFDSGGPLLYTDPDTGLLFNVGIISYGVGCGQNPGINTKVSVLLRWIVSSTQTNYCVK